jgi:diguanylate cyclase (GGDEF)-like protein
VPLHHGGTVVGVVLVAGDAADDLGAEEAESLEVLAAPFGAALTNALAMERAVGEAATDPVTGLPGRSAAVLVLGQALARQDRFGGHLAVLMLRVADLDRLDHAPATAGRDRVLREVAARLSASVRRVDTAARYGADQFVVVAENLTELEHGELLAGRLARAAGEACELDDGTTVGVTVTVGVALAPDVVTGSVEPMAVRTAALLTAAQAAVGGTRVDDRAPLAV